MQASNTSPVFNYTLTQSAPHFSGQSIPDNLDNLSQQDATQRSDKDESQSELHSAPTVQLIKKQRKCRKTAVALVFFALILLIPLVYVKWDRFIGMQMFQKDRGLTSIILMTTPANNKTIESLRSHLRNQVFRNSNIYVGSNYNLDILSDSIENDFPKFRESKIFVFDQEMKIIHLQSMLQEVRTPYFLVTSTEWSIQYLNQHIFNAFQSDKTRFSLPAQAHKLDNSTLDKARLAKGPNEYYIWPTLYRTQSYKNLKGGFFSLIGGSCPIKDKCSQILSKIDNSDQFYEINMFSVRKIKIPQQNIVENKANLKNQQLEKQSKLNNYEKIMREPSKQLQFRYQDQKNKKTPQKISSLEYDKNVDYIKVIESQLIEAKQVIKQYEVQPKQLPFCILICEQSPDASLLATSIYMQNYQQFQIVYYNDTNASHTYLVDLISERCTRNPVVMFVNQTLKMGALAYLNHFHQNYMAWVTFSSRNQSIQIISFIFRVFQLLKTNDFSNKNIEYLNKRNIQFQAIGMLQLCRQFTKKVDKKQIFQDSQKYSYFSILKDSEQRLKHQPYHKIIRLSQDMAIKADLYAMQRSYKQKWKPPRRSNLTMKNMEKAIQRSQEWYLPQNHLITELEYIEYNEKYNISEYVSIDKQVRFCVTIVSHNNVQNNRYKKVIDGIIDQRYANYHIVFLDDKSQDGNLEETIKYLNEVGFPKSRVKVIKNLKRNYATYNIINAAFNFCQQDDIQLMMDGDDQLIGKYAFQVMNSAYKSNPDLWVVYSNHKTNYFKFGISKPILSEEDYLNTTKNTRKPTSVLAPIRTWRVKLIRHIPPLYHRLKNGQWLDIVSDDALLHPLFELASASRIRYISEIMYDYNVNYGGTNINRTPQKNNYRRVIYNYLLTLKPLNALASLEEATKNEQIWKILARDNGTKYKQVNLSNYS